MNPEIILRILIWGVVIILLVASAGLYQGNFAILRWAVSLSGVALAYTVYQSRKFYWLFVFIAAIIIFNPIIPLHLYSVNIWRVIDLITAVAFGTFLWSYYNYYRKGYQFEKYIALLFPTDIWVIVDKTRDFSKVLKRRVESDTNPDFTFRHIKTDRIFAVECKYRSYFYKGGVEWDKRKGENYRIYSRRHGLPVFVAIGIGGSPKSPKRLFFCPLDRLNNSRYQIIMEEELRQFERNPQKQFISTEEIIEK